MARFAQPPTPLYVPDQPPSGGAPASPDPPVTPPVTPPPPPLAGESDLTLIGTPKLLGPDPWNSLTRMVEKQGGRKRTLEVLFDENHTHREEKRLLTSSLDTANRRAETAEARAAGDGISSADADELAKFKALGTVEELTTKATKYDEVASELGDFKMAGVRDTVATLSGYDAKKVGEVVKGGVFAVREKEVEKAGTTNGETEKVKFGVVVTKDADGKDVDTPFDEHIKAAYPSLAESLLATQEKAGPRRPILPVQTKGTGPTQPTTGFEGLGAAQAARYTGPPQAQKSGT